MGQMVPYGAGALRAAFNCCGGASRVKCRLGVLVVVGVGPSPLPEVKDHLHVIMHLPGFE
jgi:hypothetical protein